MENAWLRQMRSNINVLTSVFDTRSVSHMKYSEVIITQSLFLWNGGVENGTIYRNPREFFVI